jgi:hypothetical protein
MPFIASDIALAVLPRRRSWKSGRNIVGCSSSLPGTILEGTGPLGKSFPGVVNRCLPPRPA